jgi:gluconate kinase
VLYCEEEKSWSHVIKKKTQARVIKKKTLKAMLLRRKTFRSILRRRKNRAGHFIRKKYVKDII